MSDLKSLAEGIARHGSQVVFGITGSGSTLTLLDELEKQGVAAVRNYFEGSAAMMAGTIGRLSGKAGVAYSIKGPGLANMIPGIAACWFESFPMIAIAEAFPATAGPDKAHKRIDQARLVAAVAKGTRYHSTDGMTFGELAAWAESETPGPVLLQVAGSHVRAEPAISIPQQSNDERMGVLGALEAAKRPAVIAGSYAIRAGWSKVISELGIPVFSTAAAKGVLDERRSNAAGVYTGVGLEFSPETHVLREADLVVGLGLRPTECLATRPFAVPAVNIDPVEAPGADAFEFAATSPMPPAGFWELLRTKTWGADIVGGCITALETRLSRHFLPGFVFQVVQEELGSSIRLVLDTGNFCTVGEHVWRAPKSDLLLMSGQGRYMGTSLPMAIGAAIYDPQTPVVAVAGDGGFAMYLSEARLAVERRLPVLFVLMTDGRFGSVAGRALEEGLTTAPMDVATPSWRSVMDAFGMETWSAIDAGQLRDALRMWRHSDGPGYLEICFDPDQYAQMCLGLR